jgi:hypothetical protein
VHHLLQAKSVVCRVAAIHENDRRLAAARRQVLREPVVDLPDRNRGRDRDNGPEQVRQQRRRSVDGRGLAVARLPERKGHYAALLGLGPSVEPVEELQVLLDTDEERRRLQRRRREDVLEPDGDGAERHPGIVRTLSSPGVPARLAALGARRSR